MTGGPLRLGVKLLLGMCFPLYIIWQVQAPDHPPQPRRPAAVIKAIASDEDLWTAEMSAAFEVPGAYPTGRAHRGAMRYFVSRIVGGGRSSKKPSSEGRADAAAAAPACLPSFLILGAAKCGTTTLATLLDESGVLSYGTTKEHMLVRTPEKGRHAYAKGFGTCNDTRIRYFDADPRAMHNRTDAAAVGALYTPAQRAAMQFVVTLCDPVGRTYSHYYMDRQYSAHRAYADVHGITDPNRFVAEVLSGRVPDMAPNARTDGYIHHSLYYETLLPWVKAFPESRFLLLEGSHWQPRQHATLTRVARFLGFSDRAEELAAKLPEQPIDAFRMHGQDIPFTQATRDALANRYRADSERFCAELVRLPRVELFPSGAEVFCGGLYKFTEEARKHPGAAREGRRR